MNRSFRYPIMLFKFIPKNDTYLHDFKNGRIFFRNINNYIDFENKNNDDKFGDKYEGQLIRTFPAGTPQPTITITLHNGKNENMDPFSVTGIRNSSWGIGITKEQLDRIGISCFFGVNKEDLYFSDIDGYYHLSKQLVRDLIKMMTPDRVLCYVDTPNILYNYINSRMTSLNAKQVHYYDENKDPKLSEIVYFNNHKLELAFEKRKKYIYQHEFRIMLPLSTNQESAYFKIKNKKWNTCILYNVKQIEKIKIKII